MILQTVDLTPRQNAAIEDVVGLEFPNPQHIAVRGRLTVPTANERRDAADQMRYQLYLLDRSQRRMSIEDIVSALLDNPSTTISD